MVELYPVNMRIRLWIAIIILAVIFFQQAGLLQGIGVNLNSIQLQGVSVFQLLTTLGILWVAYGLYRHKFT